MGLDKHINKRTTMECSVEKTADKIDTKTGYAHKGDTVTMKCFKYGDTIKVPKGDTYTELSAMCYEFVGDADIKKTYKIDGQPVLKIISDNKPSTLRSDAKTLAIRVYTAV